MLEEQESAVSGLKTIFPIRESAAAWLTFQNTEICFRDGSRRAALGGKFPEEPAIVTILSGFIASVEKVGLYLGEVTTTHTENCTSELRVLV